MGRTQWLWVMIMFIGCGSGETIPQECRNDPRIAPLANELARLQHQHKEHSCTWYRVVDAVNVGTVWTNVHRHRIECDNLEHDIIALRQMCFLLHETSH